MSKKVMTKKVIEKSASKNKSFEEDLINRLKSAQDEVNYKNLFKEHFGLSEIYKTYMEKNIKITNEKAGSGYYFNDGTKLWEERGNKFFAKSVMITLEQHVLAEKEKLSKIDKKTDKTPEEIKLIKAISKIYKDVTTITYCNNIFDACIPDLVDNEFIGKLNKEPNLLSIKGGRILDLKTLKVRPRTRADYFDFEINLNFDMKKDLSHAEKFFGQIMKDDGEIVEYLQINLGYCLTGEIDQRCIYVFWGKGSNGKSTMCELLRAILGKLYVAVDKNVMISDSKGSSHTAHLIPLVTARLAVYSESEEGDILDEKTIKKLTGGDEISARAVYGNQFNFKPYCKYILLTNNKVAFDFNSIPMLDRLKYIPWAARFVPEPKEEGEYVSDLEFIKKLTTEYLEEVFIWLCIGANKYYNYVAQKKPIKLPKVLEAEKQAYINELDSAAIFIKECFKKVDENRYLSRTDIYTLYVDWFKKNLATKMLKNSEFFKRLEKIGYKQIKNGSVWRVYGLEVIPEGESQGTEKDPTKTV